MIPPTLRSTDAEIAEFYGRDAGTEDHVAGRERGPLLREFAVAGAVVQSGSKSVLDVGCGGGHLGAVLIPYVLRLTLCDVVPENVEDAIGRVVRARPGSRPEGLVSLVEDLRHPARFRSFDAVTCCETIEHLRDPAAAVRDLSSIARRLVVLTTPVGTCYDDPSHLHHWQDVPELEESLRLPEVFSERLIYQIPSRFGDGGMVFLVLGVPK